MPGSRFSFVPKTIRGTTFANFSAMVSVFAAMSVPAFAQAPVRPAAAVDVDAPSIAKAAVFSASGNLHSGAAFDSKSMSGKPALVFYWSTDCLVCKSKMAELRAAAQQGGVGILLVSVDRKESDLVSYKDLVKQTTGASL